LSMFSLRSRSGLRRFPFAGAKLQFICLSAKYLDTFLYFFNSTTAF